MLIDIAARLQARPTTPLHLIVAQTRPRSAGRELYAQLPALILSGGTGPATLLPGQGEWPKHGEARLVGRGMRVAGRSIALDEVAIAQALTPLRRHALDLPPVLWDAPERVVAAPTPAPAPAPEQIPNRSESAPAELDAAERKRRIADAMARRRQALMDTEWAAAPVWRDDVRAAPDAPVVTDEPAPVAAATAAPIVADESAPVVVDDPAPVVLGAPADVTQDEPTPAAAAPAVPVPTDDPTPADVPAAAAPDEPAPAPVVVDDPAPVVTPPCQRAGLFRGTRTIGDTSAPHVPAFVPRPSPPPTPLPPYAASERPSDPAPMQEPENGWPIGPAPLGRVAIADLMSRVVAAPAIVAGLPSEQGVTKNRLVEVLTGVPRAQAKELAEILLVWFDQAGLLVEPTRPGRLRHPRALVTTNLAAIAAQLNATPCPDKGTVRAMWAESNEGRN
jgi:hypothetical protein